MDELAKLFYSPNNGYPNLHNLYKLAKKTGLNLSYNHLAEWYKIQPVNQIFTRHVKPEYTEIKPYYDQPGTFQADLMHVSRWANHNHNVNYLLNVIHIYSRYAWSVPLTSKSSLEGDIANKMQDI
jgi:hypothetical protein